MRWTVHLDGGPRRVNHAAVEVGHKIFSFGGYCTGDNYRDPTLPMDVFVLNTTTFRWYALPKAPKGELDNTPFQRYGHTAVAYEDKVFVFGGRNDHAPSNQLFCFNTSTFKWSKPRVKGQIPAQRDGHSACVIEDGMYIFGGYEEPFFRFDMDVYRLDLKTFEWRLLKCTGEKPVPRDFHTATAIGDRMYVFGGRSDSGGGWPNHLLSTEYYTNKLSYLDTTTLTWHSPVVDPPVPIGRRSHSAMNLDDKLLIFGGFNGEVNKHYADLWLLDPLTWKWTELRPAGKGPDSRRRQAMCRVDSKIFIFGGTSPYDGPPILFTPDQLQLMPDQENISKLIDHNDLIVLDLSPSLKSLCLLRVLELQLSREGLPSDTLEDLDNMTKANMISKPLRTLPLG